MLPTWVLLHTCWHAAFLIHNNLRYVALVLIVYNNNNSVYIGLLGWGGGGVANIPPPDCLAD